MSKELKALAEAATPGPWVQWVGNAAVFAGTPEVNRKGAILPGDGGRISKVCEGDLFDPSEQELADHAYIAAANPAAILELISERDALLAERDAAQKDAERYRRMRAVVIAEREGCTEELYDSECDRLLEAYDAALQGEQP